MLKGDKKDVVTLQPGLQSSPFLPRWLTLGMHNCSAPNMKQKNVLPDKGIK